MSLRVLCITSHSDRPEAETFIGLHKAGVKIEVMCPPDAPHYRRIEEAGVPITPLVFKGRFDWKKIRLVRERLKKNGYDILHLFNNKAASNGIFASYGLPVKIVCYRGIVGNVSFFDPASWMTYLHPKVDRVVCVCEAIRRHFLEMSLLGMHLPEKKFVTIYKGHDLSWYRQPAADLSDFGVPDNAFVVGCVANDRPRKGLHVLIDAARYLPEDAPVHFLLVGNMNSETLRDQIEQSPWRERFHRTGFRTDAPSLMAACDTSVLPALKREGLPKVIIESMAQGTPVIVTDSGGSPELVINGESGLIVPPGDSRALAEAIISLWKDPTGSGSMGERGRQRIAQNFRIDKTIAQTLELYHDLF